jgi:tRNA(Arg) A34 adenosine deaminase TadA
MRNATPYKPVEKFMREAINQAIVGNKKYQKYPFGAVVAKGNKIISKSWNGLPGKIDPTAHAEILAIRDASRKLNKRYLEDCVLYTTNEPCAMCSGAVVWANMKGIVYGASVKDLQKFWEKRRNEKTSTRRFIFLSAKEVAGTSKPETFIVAGFLRKDCLKLFELYDKDLKR